MVRERRPEAVVTHSPDRNLRFVFMQHPDHLATGAAVLAAVYPDARNPYAFPELREEGLAPWEASWVWLFGGPPTAQDRVVDVTEVLPEKVRACSAHGSQLAMLDRGVEDELRGFLGGTAREHGLPEGRLAEVYAVVDTR